MAFNFEKLHVWEASVDLACDIYESTKSFPKDELFGLTSQIRRSSDSISLSIAEGSTGQSRREFQRFLGYSVRSGVETVGCLYLARKKGFMEDKEFKKYYATVEHLIVKIQALRKPLN